MDYDSDYNAVSKSRSATRARPSSRRRRGEGTYLQTAPGVWRLRAYAGTNPVTGKPKQASRTVRVRTESEARRELRKFLAEVELGEVAKGPRRVADLLDAWLDQLEARGLAASTVETYRLRVDKHLKPALGKIDLGKLSAYDLDRHYAAAMKQGLAIRTVRQHHAIISAALAQAVDWDWLPRNVARKARPPALPQPDRDPTRPEDVKKLIVACDEDVDLATAITLAAITGARRGELCGLRWTDVDWDRGTLSIRRQRLPLKGGDVTAGLKTKRARTVALGPGGLAVLRHYRGALTERAGALGIEPAFDGWLLSWDCGHTPTRPKTLGVRVKSLGKRAGIPVTPHVLRHFAATQLIGAGVDVKTAAHRLGHNPEVLLRIYAAFLPQRDAEAARGLEERVGLGALPPGEAGSLVLGEPVSESLPADEHPAPDPEHR